MPDITAHSADTWVNNANADWNTCRTAAGGNLTDAGANTTYSTFGVYHNYSAGRGSAQYYLRRSYFPFDLSSYSGTATSASFKVWLHRNSSWTPGGGGANVHYLKCIVCAADTVIPISTNSSDGESYFRNIDHSTTYSDKFTPGNLGVTQHSITLNSDALTAINNAIGQSDASGIFTLGLTTYFDQLGTDTQSGIGTYTGAYKVTVHYSDSSGKEPILQLDSGVSSGYSKSVAGSDSPVKVIGIATSDIEKVIGV